MTADIQNNDMTNAIVTGGGGFLGTAVIHQLLAKGICVKSFSRSPHPHLEALKVEHIIGDISDAYAVKAAFEGCDTVFHIAAKAGIWGRYSDFYSVNVRGTKNVIDACGFYKIPRLIFTSSPSVVFNGDDQEAVDESQPYPKKFLAHYPYTKAEAEKMILSANSSSLGTVSLRPHLIWGPGDNHLVPRVISRARRGRLRKVGNLSKLVDCVYIENAAYAHILAASCLYPGSPVSGNTYFISQGEPMPMGELIDRILMADGQLPIKKTISPRTAYFTGWILEKVYSLLGLKNEPIMTRFLAKQMSTHHWFDISAAKKDIGYCPRVSIDQGMLRLSQWLSKKTD